MPEIYIEKTTFQRLQQNAKPLVDTTDMVINRALDALELQDNDSAEDECADFVKHRLDPQDLPNLTHTTIIDASLSGQSLVKPNWTMLFDNLLISAMRQVDNFFELRKLCSVNMVQGRKKDNGYRHLVEIDISVQGMSANNTCRAIVAVAQNLNIELEITLMWRSKVGALHPDEKGRLCVTQQP